MSRWRTLHIVVLLLLLVGVSIASYLFYQHELYFCFFFAVCLGAVIIYQVYHLQYKTTRMVLRMVESIRYGDFSLNFSSDKKSTYEKAVVENINEILSQFRSRLSRMEERYHYYETLLDTVDTCLLVTDREGNVLWMNHSGVQELCGYPIHSLDELKGLNKDFPQLLQALQPGEVKVIRIYREELMQDLAVTITEYITEGLSLRLINMRNIRSVLEENEMEAWQKLVRVLTHEIMNSIAPIISLSDTLSERALNGGVNEKDYGIMLQGMQTIHRRSRGLLEFVENYRKLSRLSSPVLAPVRVGDLLDDIKKLFLSKNISYIYKVENEDRMLMIDRSQMEQVLINLLKNAGEACSEQPAPEVLVETRFQAEKRLFSLMVSDNGNGILPEVLDKIFIPFFTTKPTGSGIGLSLCKQIMTLHGGSIRANSEVGKGSCFTLRLFVS